MPKNFSGANTKAESPRARQTVSSATKVTEKAKRLEEAFWQENDKHVARKQKRKDERTQKKQAALTRRAENKAILEKEAAKIIATQSSSPGSGPKSKLPVKVTRAQIEATIEAVSKPKPVKKSPLVENTNRTSATVREARNIMEAIKIFDWQPEEIDKHPEKRLKAAFSSYEQSRLVVLRKIHPTLRISQLKQMIFKEWQKAAENPLNKKVISV